MTTFPAFPTLQLPNVLYSSSLSEKFLFSGRKPPHSFLSLPLVLAPSKFLLLNRLRIEELRNNDALKAAIKLHGFYKLQNPPKVILKGGFVPDAINFRKMFSFPLYIFLLFKIAHLTEAKPCTKLYGECRSMSIE